jgi:hypothetical protein
MASAAMRIHVLNPELVDDLAVYLRAAECAVERAGTNALEVDIPRAPSRDQARRELELYLAAWRAMHENARAELLD